MKDCIDPKYIVTLPKQPLFCGDPIVVCSIQAFEAIKENYMDMISQACSEWDRDQNGQRVFKGYDSMCLSAYEDGLRLAAALGWIKEEEILR